MKINIQSSILFLVILSTLLACNKNENPLINQANMWDCHHKTTWDSLKIKKTLIGEWTWEYFTCSEEPDTNKTEFKGLTIEFRPDNTLDMKKNGQTTQTSNWKVVDGDADLFAINVAPSVFQLHGQILFCCGRVEFNNSNLDGCDNYFKRKE